MAEVPTNLGPQGSVVGAAAESTVVEVGVEANSIAAELSGGAGRSMGASMLGEGLAWAWAVGEMGHAVMTAASDGRVRTILDQAFPRIDTRATNYQVSQRLSVAAGVGAVLTGASEAELDRMADHHPGTAFSEAVHRARQLMHEHPADFQEARALYLDVKRQWDDGVTAALEQWYDGDRGPIFKHAYAATNAAIASGDPAMRAAQRQAMARKREGITDVALGRVDGPRLSRDASYRSGVHYGREVRELRGQEGLDMEMERIELNREFERAWACQPVRG
jgi:hypothetical protein